jgi:hypothetical protein
MGNLGCSRTTIGAPLATSAVARLANMQAFERAAATLARSDASPP